MKKLVEDLSHAAQAMEFAYWAAVKDDACVVSISYRDALKRIRGRIYNLQKARGVLG